MVTVVLATAIVVVLEAAVKISIQGIHMLFCQWSVYNVEAHGMFSSKLVCISKKSMYSSSRTERERESGDGFAVIYMVKSGCLCGQC